MKTKSGQRRLSWKGLKRFGWLIDRDMEFVDAGEIYRGPISAVQMTEDSLIITVSALYGLAKINRATGEENDWESLLDFSQEIEIPKNEFDIFIWNNGTVSFQKPDPGPDAGLVTLMNYGLSVGYHVLMVGDKIEETEDDDL